MALCASSTTDRTGRNTTCCPTALKPSMSGPKTCSGVFRGNRSASASNYPRCRRSTPYSSTHILALYPVNPQTSAGYRRPLKPSRARDAPVDARMLLNLASRHPERLLGFDLDLIYLPPAFVNHVNDLPVHVRLFGKASIAILVSQNGFVAGNHFAQELEILATSKMLEKF